MKKDFKKETKRIYDIIPIQDPVVRKAVSLVTALAILLGAVVGGYFFFGGESTKAAAGDVILLWEGDTIPEGWTCISCTATSAFFGVFPRGSSTYDTATSGADIATHTASFVSHSSGTAQTISQPGTTFASLGHSHAVSGIAVASSDIRPPFKNLKFISANTSTLPSGVIGIFDAASSSLPANWSYYTPTANLFLRGENSTTTGGVSQHTHTLTATADGSTGTAGAFQGGGTQVAIADNAHTHSVSGSVLAASNTPAFLGVVFAKLGTTGTVPVGLIAMFDGTPPGGWVSVSGAGGDFNGRFIQGSDSYGTTGGAAAHGHDTSTITGGIPSATSTARSGGNSVADDTHTHNFTFGSVSSESSQPVFRDVIFAKKQPAVIVSATGTQTATTSVPVSNFHIGGAFGFIRDSGTTTVSQITITDTGTVSASASITNVVLFYKEEANCSTTIPGDAAQFNASGVGFNGSEKATATGTMTVGTTTQVCVYVRLDVSGDALAGQTIEIEISDPSAEVAVAAGIVNPGTAVALSGTTSIPSSRLIQKNFRIYRNTASVVPTSTLAAENASTSDIVSGDVLRFRMNVEVQDVALATSSEAFRLQFAAKGSATSCAAVAGSNFSDVGLAASSTAWRGFDNSGIPDGASASSTVLASSTAAETYEEENPTASNTVRVAVGGAGEWDFVVENNAATSGVAFCFRMVTSGGATLSVYTNFPEVVTRDPATWMAPEDTPTSTKINQNIRLRVEISNDGNVNDSGSFRLEYSSSTLGPWTAITADAGCAASSTAFRICNSANFKNLDPTSNRLTAEALTFIAGFMLDASSVAPLIALDVNQFTEYEWNLQATESAAENQTYYFRVTDNGAKIGTYSLYPQLNITPTVPILTQNYYRWYANADAVTPTDPWPPGATDLGENTAITGNDTPPLPGDVLRLRMSVAVTEKAMATSSQSFKLQFGERSTTCGAIASSSWQDVGQIASTTVWRGFNNTSTADGATLPSTTLSVSDISGTYEEENPSASNTNAVGIGQDIEYDWVIEHNNASSAVTYCFRMVESGGTALSGYNFYPTIATRGYDPKSENWQWYDDEANETPTSSMAAENVAPANVANQNIVKLRLTVRETAGTSGSNIKFKLQYSEDSDFGEAHDLAEAGSCNANSIWCYADGGGSDNAVIAARVLSDSSANGTHNESGVSTSSFTMQANTATEFDFTLRHAGARANRTYFFRAYDVTNNSPVPANAAESLPSLVTEGAALSFTISGLGAGTSTEGVTLNGTSTPSSVSFGNLGFETEINAAQRLAVSTNATEGYQIFVFQRQGFVGDVGSEIPPVATTNASPASWSTACTSTSTGCYGYHAGDDTLSGNPARFAPNDTFARFESQLREIAYSSMPVVDESIDILFRTEVTNRQEAGLYGTTIVYIVVPVF